MDVEFKNTNQHGNAEHATKNDIPAMLFMGCNLRSRLDLLKPDLQKGIGKKQCDQMATNSHT